VPTVFHIGEAFEAISESSRPGVKVGAIFLNWEV
jgi:hypothetical protein